MPHKISRRHMIGQPILLAGVLGCSTKKDDIQHLPQDNNVFELCVPVTPADATVLVSAKETDENHCIVTNGEVFVEVTAPNYAPYQQTLLVQQNMKHEVILLSLDMVDPTRFASGNLMPPPLPPMPSLCIKTEPSSAYIQINGQKVQQGECVFVQMAVDVEISAPGYATHKELLSVPSIWIDKNDSVIQHSITLIKSDTSTEPQEY